MPWTVEWAVRINGVNRSAGMRPYLLSIEVTDKDGQASDSCRLTFDDKGGQIRMPDEGAALEVDLDGATVFSGTVDSVRSTGSRGGGRKLHVSAKGVDLRGKAKEGQRYHLDDASLEDFLGKAARQAGLSLIIDPSLGKIMRDYWGADGESFVALGQRLAREMNATFKIRGQQAVFMLRGNNPLAAAIGRVGPGGNVISWDISPYTGRGVYTRARARWFDREKAKFEEEELEIGLDRDLPDAANVVRSTAYDKDQAKAIAEARKREAERDAGEGTVLLDLCREAQAEALFKLSGARHGVDGTYRIVSVTHKADRSGGATTALDLKQPQDGAGKDER